MMRQSRILEKSYFWKWLHLKRGISRCAVLQKGRSFPAKDSGLGMKSTTATRRAFDDVDVAEEDVIKYKPAIEPEEDIPHDLSVDPVTGVQRLDPLEPEDFEEDEEDEVYLGRKLLEHSKVQYRHSDPLPSWFLEKQKEMTSNRSGKQIRRCLKSWMIKHDLQEMKQYLNRPFHWNIEQKKGYKDPVSGRTAQYTYGPEETVAYAYFHLPPRYTITKRLFQDLRRLTKDTFTPKRILDYGCGPGTVAAAIASVWPDSAKSMSYTGIELSQAMIDAAKIMTQDLIPNATFWSKTSDIITRALDRQERYDCIVCSYTLTEFMNDEQRRVATQVLYELLEPNGYILFLENGNPIGSHTIRTARQYLLHLSQTMTRQGQFELYRETASEEIDLEEIDDDFLLTEEERKAEEKKRLRRQGQDLDEEEEEEEGKDPYSSFEDTDDNVSPLLGEKPLSLKQRMNKAKAQASLRKEKQKEKLMMILPPPKTFLYDEMKVKVIAPCTHDQLCPLSKDTWCHFSQKVVSAAIKKDQEEKFSYVLLQKAVTKSRMNAAETGHKSLPSIPLSPWLQKVPALDLQEPVSNLPALAQLTPLQMVNRFIYHIENRHTKEITQLLRLSEKMDWENYPTISVRHEFGRIVRSPMKERGHVVMDICLPTGEVTRYTHSRSMLQYIPHLYRAMRKSTWGGMLPAFMVKRSDESIKAVEGKMNDDLVPTPEFSNTELNPPKLLKKRVSKLEEENSLYAAVLNQLAHSDPAIRRKLEVSGFEVQSTPQEIPKEKSFKRVSAFKKGKRGTRSGSIVEDNDSPNK